MEPPYEADYASWAENVPRNYNAVEAEKSRCWCPRGMVRRKY